MKPGSDRATPSGEWAKAKGFGGAKEEAPNRFEVGERGETNSTPQ